MHHKVGARTKEAELAYYNHLNNPIPNTKCIRCGWDEGPCDRHRIDPKGDYTVENVRILCPNCHRLVTIGKVIVD